MDEIMTTKEVARLLRLHPLTVIARCKEGTLPGYRLGAQYRFMRRDIQKLFKEEEENEKN